MAKKSWLKTLEEVLSGYSGAPREKVTPNSRKIGSNTSDPSDWYGAFHEPNRTFDSRPLDEGEAATALRNDPDNWGSNRYNLSSNPYARDQIGINKEPQRTVNMKVSDPRAWTMNQLISGSYGGFPKSSNDFVRALQDANAAVNRNINRGVMYGLNALDGKLIPREKARRAKQAVRNTARMDEQLLIGSKGMPRSEQAYKELYNYNKARAAEARDVAGFIPKSPIQGEASRTLRDYVNEEEAFRDAYANTYKPSNAYRVIRGAAKISPFLLGGAYASGAFGKRAKSSKKTSEPICDCGKPVSQCTCSGHKHNAKTKKSMLKSISSINQNGTRHVVGGYKGSKMSKAMDMRTQSPKMPSTKRDVRHTDKYFN